MIPKSAEARPQPANEIGVPLRKQRTERCPQRAPRRLRQGAPNARPATPQCAQTCAASREVMCAERVRVQVGVESRVTEARRRSPRRSEQEATSKAPKMGYPTRAHAEAHRAGSRTVGPCRFPLYLHSHSAAARRVLRDAEIRRQRRAADRGVYGDARRSRLRGKEECCAQTVGQLLVSGLNLDGNGGGSVLDGQDRS
jgi:hypothetical protein